MGFLSGRKRIPADTGASLPPADGRVLSKRRDTYTIKPGKDGLVHDECWFCGAALEFDARSASADAAFLMIEPVGDGEPRHGVCHRACADRAKGSLAPST